MLMTANAHELLISVIVTGGCNQGAARTKPDELPTLRRGGHDHGRKALLGPAFVQSQTAHDVAEP